MKKLLALLLALVLLAAALPLVAAEETKPFTVTLPDSTLFIGENENIVTVTVEYETGLDILDGMLEVSYDPEALELQIPKKTDRLCHLSNAQVNVDQPGLIRIAFMDSSGLDEAGVIGDFPFKVSDPEIGAEHTVSIRFIRLMCRGETPVGVNLVTDTEDFFAEGTIRIAQRPPVDLSHLQQAVEAPVNDIEIYSPASVAVYEAALAAARKVLADPNTTQEKADEALETLNAALAALTTQPDQPAVLKGDADGNGKVDSTDARLTLQIAVNKITKADIANPDAVDINGDGAVTSTDARLILQYAVGKIKEWP